MYKSIIVDEGILQTDEDILRYIYEKLGYEIHDTVSKWHDTREQRIAEYDSDLDSYEEELNQQNYAASEIFNMVLSLRLCVQDVKRINRQTILERLNMIERELKCNFDV